jgi:RNA-directed DNA polymerase
VGQLKAPKWVRSICQNQGNRRYVLQGTYLGRRGEPRIIRLTKAADVSIKRHVKIKAAVNPYDSDWETYFEERTGLRMKDNLYGYNRLLKRWFNQDDASDVPPTTARES